MTLSSGLRDRGLKTESLMVNFISAAALFNKLENGEDCLVVDLRTIPEYQRDRLDYPTIHMPLDQLDSAQLSHLAAGRPVYLLCRSDARARHAARQLAGKGLDLVIIEGGLMACWAKRPMSGKS